MEGPVLSPGAAEGSGNIPDVAFPSLSCWIPEFQILGLALLCQGWSTWVAPDLMNGP